MTKPEFDPFADNAASLTFGGLTIENGADRVAVYGTLDLTRDRAGLELAKRLKAILDAAVARLEADSALPDEAPKPKPAGKRKNPFT